MLVMGPGARVPAREFRCGPSKIRVAGLIGNLPGGQLLASRHVYGDARSLGDDRSVGVAKPYNHEDNFE